MGWKKLRELKQTEIWRGARLRFPAKWPYKSIVEIMVFEAEHGTLGLMVVTGYKSGLTFRVLPVEALAPGTMAISAKWLVKNWSKIIYPETLAEHVLVDLGGRKVRGALAP